MVNLIINIGCTAEMIDSTVEQLRRDRVENVVFHIASGTRAHVELVGEALEKLAGFGVKAAAVPRYSEESDAFLDTGREGASAQSVKVLGMQIPE